MANLIAKDYFYTKKQGLIALVFCALVPMLLILDGGDKLYWAQFYIPFFSGSLLLSKITLKEDSIDVRNFLKLLPYNKYIRIGSRFIFVISVIVMAEVYLCGVQYFIFKQPIKYILTSNVLFTIVFILYYSFYIVLAICYGYYVAQNSIFFCMAIAGAGVIAYEKLGIDFSQYIKSENNYGCVFIGIGIVFLLYIIACKCDEKREN